MGMEGLPYYPMPRAKHYKSKIILSKNLDNVLSKLNCEEDSLLTFHNMLLTLSDFLLTLIF